MEENGNGFKDLNGEIWTFFGTIPESSYNEDYQQMLKDRFLSAVLLHDEQSREGSVYYDVYVRGFPEGLDKNSPGGGFFAVGEIREGDDLETKTENIKQIILSQGGDCEVDIVITEGPRYSAAEFLPKQFRLERDTSADKVIWMRWRYRGEN